MAEFLEPNLLQEAVFLGVRKDQLEIEREKDYLRQMEIEAQKIETISNFLDLIAARTQTRNEGMIHLNSPKESALVDKAREVCPTVLPEATYSFQADHLLKIAERLHDRITNVHQPRLTQIQTVMTQEKMLTAAIFESMASIVKRSSQAMKEIISNMRPH